MEKDLCISINELLFVNTTIITSLFICFFLYNRNNRAYVLNLEEQLRNQEILHRKDLIDVTIKVQEEERFRIGQNLHDDVGNSLASLKLTIDMLLFDYLDRAAFDVYKTNCKILIDKVIQNVRSISHNLSPASLELFGLFAAVEDLVETINHTGNLEVLIQNEAEEVINKIQQSTALSLFRVLEELLTNTIKHAGAKKVLITFFLRGHSLILLYEDDGKGMDEIKSKGMGLHNIRNRLQLINANYVITTYPCAGFIIEITTHIL